MSKEACVDASADWLKSSVSQRVVRRQEKLVIFFTIGCISHPNPTPSETLTTAALIRTKVSKNKCTVCVGLQMFPFNAFAAFSLLLSFFLSIFFLLANLN